MAYSRGQFAHISEHPITGVKLNVIAHKRRALNFNEAVTAHILKQQGATYTDIVHKLGTNANRVGEVLRGEVHPDASGEALKLLTS